MGDFRDQLIAAPLKDLAGVGLGYRIKLISAIS